MAAEHESPDVPDLAVPDEPGRSLVTFPNQTIGPAVGTTDPATLSVLAAGGIPATALDAYRRAAAAANPACGITWPLLAAIGRVESNHGRFAGATLHSDGSSTPPIIGIRLDGSRSVVVRDTDGGRLDGDPTYDHAVGPMQFIPSTWAVYRADGNGDGRYDPFNIYDAAAATANYLCQAGETCAPAPVSSGRCGPTTRLRHMCPRCSLSRPHMPRVPASWFRYRRR